MCIVQVHLPYACGAGGLKFEALSEDLVWVMGFRWCNTWRVSWHLLMFVLGDFGASYCGASRVVLTLSFSVVVEMRLRAGSDARPSRTDHLPRS
jgi:hypothetical protein